MTDSLDKATADFASHPIEGYARAAQEKGETGYFSVPLISHIDGNLWTGGCTEGFPLPHDFEFVVSLYPWEKFALGPDTVRVEIKMYDAGEIPELRQLHDVARIVNAFRAKGKTLVHCQAGLNRSGLVAALALILDGTNPTEAVRLLREKRCDMVLCNAAFERFLHDYEPPALETAA